MIWDYNGPDQDEPMVWESHYIKLEGEGRNSGDQVVRPNLTIGNPNAILHVPVSQVLFDGAKVFRYLVQPQLLSANPPIYEKTEWYMSQIPQLTDGIQVQLRSNSDRQEATMPTRQYIPPDFPTVEL